MLSAGAESDPQIQGLKDKVVIIAYESTGIQDIHQTPYSRGFLNFSARFMSGPEVHANIVETLLTGRFPRPVSAPWRLTYLVMVLTVGTAVFFKLSPRQGLAVLGLLAVMVAVFAYLWFRHDWLMPVAIPQLGLLASYLGVLGLRLTGEERERTRLRQIFGRYVSDAVVEKLLATGKQPNLGGEAVTVTVLFSDIRNFTPMSESLAPQEVVELLNNYFSRACEPILEKGGTVDKFIGDAIMAVFGSPAPHPDHARRAIAAALALAERASDFQAWIARRFPGRDWQEFQIGIGLHTGEVVVGNVGSPKRFEFTAIGDTVNTASRLESLTKELGWTIVASVDTIKAAGPGVVTGGAKQVRVKGRQDPVEVLEVKGLKQDQPRDIPDGGAVMKAKRSMKYAGFFCLAGFVALLTATVAAQTSLPDVGLITKLTGAATYGNKGDGQEPAKVQAFMKVRQGDHLKLPAAASLTLLYFASGRQETWKGPVTLMAGDRESKVLGGKQPAPQPEVKIIPAKASRQMVGAPLPLSPASMGKSGVIQTMGPGREPAARTAPPLSENAQRKIREAETVYRDLKQAAAADDVTPELYFFSVLAEYNQYPEMAKVVDTMLQKRPGDAALKDLKAWVRSQAAASR